MVSVNSIYYLDNESDSILDNINEALRVLKVGGTISSFVGEDHFVMEGALKVGEENVI